MASQHFTTPPEMPGPTGAALCALCASGGGCCCSTDPALGHLSFPLSAAEWRRLSAFAALATEASPADGEKGSLQEIAAEALAERLAVGNADVAVERTGTPPESGDDICQPWVNTPDFIASMHGLFPAEKERIDELFLADETHLALRLRADGSCVFLGQNGCRLPRQGRPWYCLLFPAWVMSGGPALFTAQGCLIAERARGPLHGIGLMEESLPAVRELYRKLRRDWGLD